MSIEVWKPVVGYEGLYEVSSYGRVRNRYGRILLIETTRVGYLRVSLYVNCHQKHYLVHRLVAHAFLPNPHHYPEVNHKDENPSNNCVENLEWCSRTYNMRYGGGVSKRADKNKNPIIVFDNEHKLGTYFQSATDAAPYFNVSRQAIYHALKHYRGKQTCCGCLFEYV